MWMQLIVLGQIPGTHFQITFNWYTFLTSLGIGSVVYWLYRTRLQKIKAMQRRFDIISLRALDQAL